MSKPTGEWGLIREHKVILPQKCQSTSPVHQSSPLVQSSDCRLPTSKHLFSHKFIAYLR